MFTAITLDPKSVAMFAANPRCTDPELRDYAIELVTDLQRAIDDLCSDGRIDALSDDNTVDFKFRSECNLWEGCIWVSVYDDLPGCPVEVNCSVTLPDLDETTDYPTDRAYESFDLVTVSAYSRSDVSEINAKARHKEVEAYVKGYAAGQDYERGRSPNPANAFPTA